MTGISEPGDLYELLGVPRDAPAAEITRAYHRRARALHPDTQPGAGGAARFRELEEAYRVLHDPARRAAYDQALHQAAAVSFPPPRSADWPRPLAWPVTRPLGCPVAPSPGAALWAGPVRVTPPGAATGDLADNPGSVLGWEWGWPG